MRKLLLLIMVLIVGVVLIGCDRDITIELNAPANVSLTGSVVSWDAVEDAEGYRVVVNVTPHNVTTTSFDLGTLGLAPGSYTITIVATAGTSVSLPSSSVTFVVIDETELTQPTITGITDGVLAWSAVDTAESYVVSIAGNDYPVSTTSFDLGELFLSEGDYPVTVTALRGEDASEPSLAATYSVSVLLDVDAVYALVLSTMNPGYAPEMTEEDFEDEYEFDNYQRMSGMAMAYVNAAAASQLTSEDAASLFVMVSQIPEMLPGADDLSAAMFMMDTLMSTVDVGEDELANILMHMLMFALEEGLLQQTELVAMLENELILAEDYLLAAFSSPEYQALYSTLLPYVPSYYQSLFDLMFSIPEELYFVSEALDLIGIIAWDLAYNLESHDPWYLTYDNVYVPMFYEILMNMAVEGSNQEFLEALSDDPWTVLNPFFEILNANRHLQILNEELASFNQSLVMMTMLKTMLESDSQLFVSTLAGVIEYMGLIYDTISDDLIAQIDTLILEGYLTLEEAMILKDEVIYVLETTLPTPEDFETLFTTLFYIGETMSGFDLDFIASRASALADIEHMTISLMLDIIGDVDQTVIEDIMLITEDLIIPGYYEPYTYEQEYWDEVLQDWAYETVTDEYWVDDSVNPYVVVDLLVYVVGYIDNLETVHATEIAAIEAVYGAAFNELFLADLTLFVKAQLQQLIPPQEFMMISGMIDELVSDLPNIEDGLAVFELLGDDLIDWFLTTEGGFFHELFFTIEFMQEVTDPYDAVLQLETMIAQIAILNDVLFAYGDAETIEGVLRVFRVPLMFASMQSGMFETYADFDLFFDDVVGALAALVAGVATIEQKLINEADMLEVAELMYNSGWIIEDEEAATALILLVLDATFSEDIEILVETMIATIFDDLLGSDLVMMMLELDEFALAEMKNDALLSFGDIMEELEVVAGYDLTIVTPEEIDSMDLFFENLGEILDSLFNFEVEEPVLF